MTQANDTREMSLAALVAEAGGHAPELERYQLRSQLGSGAAGVVFECFDTKLRMPLAVKVVRSNGNSIVDSKRFHREARALSEINHPNVVRVIDFSRAGDPLCYLLLERLSGRTLSQLVEEREIPVTVAMAIGHELATALMAVHGAGIVHRDVKPDNVYVEHSGRVVLIDFGLVKGIRTAEDASDTFAMSHTRAVGTPAFTSPEQAALQTTTVAQSDLFSLGATLYFALTKRPPFFGNDLEALFAAVRTQKPEPLSKFRDVPSEVEKLIDVLLDKDPSKRFADAKAAQRAFMLYLRSQGVVSPSATINSWIKNEATTDLEGFAGEPPIMRTTKEEEPKVDATVVITKVPERKVKAPKKTLPTTTRDVLFVSACVAIANVLLAAYWLTR
jgi:serine/threonine protein kinase